MRKSKGAPASGNLFADLGIDKADEYLQKVDLAVQINDIVAAKRLTQHQASLLLGIDQPKVSLLKRGLLDAFSIERLMKFLRLLGHECEIRPKRRPQLEGHELKTKSYSGHVHLTVDLGVNAETAPRFIKGTPEGTQGLQLWTEAERQTSTVHSTRPRAV